jgi:hypothetical protein
MHQRHWLAIALARFNGKRLETQRRVAQQPGHIAIKAGHS